MNNCPLQYAEYAKGKPCKYGCQGRRFPHDPFWYDDDYHYRSRWLDSQSKCIHLVTISEVGPIHFCWVVELRHSLPSTCQGR